MNIAVTLITLLAQYGPDVYAKAVEILHKPDPTKDDFLALHALVASADASVADATKAIAEAK